MDIRTLRYFVEVVRQQSFTRAAEKLFVTQPTISKMLKNLEDELNCTLLIRDGRKLLLTDTGRVVFERGLAILAEFRQLEAELGDINHLNKGLLRLGIPPMVGMLMAGPIGLFRQRYPGVELKVSEFGGLTVQQAVMNGELDVAMTALPVEEESGLATLPVFSHPLCVLVPRSGQWTTCQSVSPEALAEHPLLIYNEDFALSRQLMQLFSEHDVKPRIAVRSGQWDFLAAMVREIREELAVDIRVDRFVVTVEHQYPEFFITMHCYLCEFVDGSPTLLEHSAARWVDAASIDSLDWLAADVDVVAAIKEQGIV